MKTPSACDRWLVVLAALAGTVALSASSLLVADVTAAEAAPDTAALRPFWWVIPDSVPTVFGIPVDSLAAPRDSVWGFLPAIEVTGTTTAVRTGPERVGLDALALRQRDPAAAADLAPLLPATRLVVNSRGESQFMVRGASERHLKVLFGGIPLNVPWDERVDLSLVPVGAVGAVEATRGIGSALREPNAIAGTIALAPAALPGDGRRTVLAGRIGQGSRAEGRLLQQWRGGPWEVLAALSRRERGAFLLPDGLALPHHQLARRERTNSDLEQGSAVLRVGRALAGGGRLSLLALGLDGSKGVPPEGHLAEGARFWRYPEQRRVLLGLDLALPLDAGGRWELQGALAGDHHRLEIRPYDDASYAASALAPGAEYEIDRDRTGHVRLRLTRRLARGSSAAVQATGRYTRHQETLAVEGPETDSSQLVAGAVAELDLRPAPGWAIRTGAGWEVAATPESGDKPGRDPTGAEVLHVALERSPSAATSLHASAGRRSRFPALRELYSGALGRFLPNPDLRPERQDLFEVGATTGGARWSLGAGAFAGWLDGGIERVVSPDTRLYQRVNVDRIRTLGLEATFAWRPRPELSLSAHHAILNARREVAGRWAGAAEDRPDYLSYLSAGWSGASGARLGVELEAVGGRHGLDPTAAGGLTRLPSQAQWNLRAGWVLRHPPLPGVTRAELLVRLDNVLDQRVDAQVGLPQPGRTVVLGVDLWADEWSDADRGVS